MVVQLEHPGRLFGGLTQPTESLHLFMLPVPATALLENTTQLEAKSQIRKDGKYNIMEPECREFNLGGGIATGGA